MIFSDEVTIEASREIVWSLIFEPETLVKLIPGCEQLEQVSPEEYRGWIRLQLSAFMALYEVRVMLTEVEELQFCSYKAEITGSTGNITGSARFDLSPKGEHTLIRYQARGFITGAVARLGTRLVEGVAQASLEKGFEALNQMAIAATEEVEPDWRL